MSFSHGAQDGLKFIGIFHMYMKLVTNNVMVENDTLIMIICALTMGLGTAIGGKRIVTTVGEKMIKLSNNNALCSDFSTVITLILANLFGMPVSTTHVKTISIAVFPGNKGKLNKNKFVEIALAWGLTFPICFIIAFVIMKLVA